MSKLTILIIIASIGVIVLERKRIAGDIANKIKKRDETVRNVTKNLKDKTAKGIDWLTDQWEKSKSRKSATTDVIACPECGQRLRIPKDVNLSITCPRTKCKAVFDHIGKKSVPEEI